MRHDFPPLPGSFAEFHARLGGIPLDRIRMTPPPGMATVADLIAAEESADRIRCELIDGTLIEKMLGCGAGVLSARLLCRLWKSVEDEDAGVVLPGTVAFRIRDGLILRPSCTFTPWERLPGEELPDEKVPSFTPALVVEFLDCWGTVAEIERRLPDYFAAGCKLAWVIDPDTKTAKVYSSAKRFRAVDVAGALDGGKVLPGFKLPLADLFAATKRRKGKSR